VFIYISQIRIIWEEILWKVFSFTNEDGFYFCLILQNRLLQHENLGRCFISFGGAQIPYEWSCWLHYFTLLLGDQTVRSIFRYDSNPVNFNTANKKEMLLNLKRVVWCPINSFKPRKTCKLNPTLRTATVIEMIHDKDATTSNDVLDAMTLACKRISINRQENQRFDFKVAV
jgi:hypothetical protein